MAELEQACPQCGKVIRSLYQKQLDANMMMHQLTHKDLLKKWLLEATKK